MSVSAAQQSDLVTIFIYTYPFFFQILFQNHRILSRVPVLYSRSLLMICLIDRRLGILILSTLRFLLAGSPTISPVPRYPAPWVLQVTGKLTGIHCHCFTTMPNLVNDRTPAQYTVSLFKNYSSLTRFS